MRAARGSEQRPLPFEIYLQEESTLENCKTQTGCTGVFTVADRNVGAMPRLDSAREG